MDSLSTSEVMNGLPLGTTTSLTDTIVPVEELKEFTIFPEMLIELQLDIWTRILEIGRVITIDDKLRPKDRLVELIVVEGGPPATTEKNNLKPSKFRKLLSKAGRILRINDKSPLENKALIKDNGVISTGTKLPYANERYLTQALFGVCRLTREFALKTLNAHVDIIEPNGTTSRIRFNSNDVVYFNIFRPAALPLFHSVLTPGQCSMTLNLRHLAVHERNLYSIHLPNAAKEFVSALARLPQLETLTVVTANTMEARHLTADTKLIQWLKEDLFERGRPGNPPGTLMHPEGNQKCLMAWSTAPISINEFLKPFKKHLKNNPGWKIPKVKIMCTVSPGRYPSSYMVRGFEVYDMEAKQKDDLDALARNSNLTEFVEIGLDGRRPFLSEDLACDACCLHSHLMRPLCLPSPLSQSDKPLCFRCELTSTPCTLERRKAMKILELKAKDREEKLKLLNESERESFNYWALKEETANKERQEERENNLKALQDVMETFQTSTREKQLQLFGQEITVNGCIFDDPTDGGVDD